MRLMYKGASLMTVATRSLPKEADAESDIATNVIGPNQRPIPTKLV
jgi:hypothetical protein